MTEPVYSPGLEGIIAGETAVSTVTGGLRYRGYGIEDLAEHATYEEVGYLLLHGELPNGAQLGDFRNRLSAAAEVPGDLYEILRRLPTDAPPMDVMRSVCSLLSHWDPDHNDNSHDANVRKAERLLAQLPVLIAARFRINQDKEPVPAEAGRSLAGNLLYMLFRREPQESHVRALDVSLILYAEHEYNASAFTARVIASTLSDMHSAITGAIGALKGPLHGGANEQAMKVLREVGSKENAEPWTRNALAEKRRIMGFGHRVYKSGDPRAVYLQQFCGELANQTGNQDMEQMAQVVEQIVADEKGLRPNVDWPSARLYHYLGLPTDLYTPLFVLSRVAGWAAHVIEQHDHNRLIRPLSRYTGPDTRPWVPIENR